MKGRLAIQSKDVGLRSDVAVVELVVFMDIMKEDASREAMNV